MVKFSSPVRTPVARGPHICPCPWASTATCPLACNRHLQLNHHHTNALQKDLYCHHNLDTLHSDLHSQAFDCAQARIHKLANCDTILGRQLDPTIIKSRRPLLALLQLLRTKTGRHCLPPLSTPAHLRNLNRPAARPFVRPSSPKQPRAWIPIWRMSGACLQILLLPLLPSPPPFPRSMAGLRA